MNSINLATQDVAVIENLIAKYGAIVTLEQIAQVLDNLGSVQLRKKVSQLAKKGWLFRIKRGVYAVCDISQRGSLAISHYTVSNLLVEDSYISFEAALQYHGLYDQLLQTMRAVSLTRYQDSEVGSITYRFITTTEKHYYGWAQHWIDGQQVKVATIEKALIDLVKFHRSTYTVDLVIETVGEYQDDLDWDKLYTYLTRSTIAVQRIFGFILDGLGLDETASRVHDLVKKQKNSSRVTAHSEMFNARWRLYYNEHLQNYQPSTAVS